VSSTPPACTAPPQARPAPPPARPVYLDADEVADPIFGFLHMPADGQGRQTAVLICPPFGWDDICSYRSRRDWAEHLAAAGHPTLRIDLPGAGDSGGSPEDPRRLAAWTVAAGSAAGWLSATTSCHHVAAIGIGLGGLVICRALGEGAPIDEVVLWAVPSRGHAFVRELRAFGRMETSRFAAHRNPGPSPLPNGSTEAGGFVLSPETTQALETLDVATLAIPDGQVHRALLLERDGIRVDTRLKQRLEEAGAEVTVAPGRDFGAMMAEPQEARSPTEVFALVESWLGETRHGSVPASPEVDRLRLSTTTTRAAEDHNVADLTVNGVRVSETPLMIEQPFGRMFGVLAEPVDASPTDLCAVLLNAGAIRRIGPNRMWVEIARRWAARGVPSLRLDLEGLGDTDGDADRFTSVAELYVPEMFDQTRAALDVLETRGPGRRFVLAGLCSGAFWSFHGALRDERVSAAFMLNPRTLFWDASQETVRYLRRGLLKPSSWQMIARGEVPFSRVSAVARQAPLSLVRHVVAERQARRTGSDELADTLDRLRDTGKRLVFVFSEEEPFHEELERQGRLEQGDRWPNLEVDLIPGRDHTLRPLYSQRHAHDALDRALDRELASLSRA